MKIDYLNNKTFENMIEKFRNTKKELDVSFSEELDKEYQSLKCDLGKAFLAIAEGLLKKYKFQLIDHDDALQEGVMTCFQKINHFEKGRGSAFNLYTTIIINHYKQMHRSVKVYNDFKLKYQDHVCEATKDVYSKYINGANVPVFIKKRIQTNDDD